MTQSFDLDTGTTDTLGSWSTASKAIVTLLAHCGRPVSGFVAEIRCNVIAAPTANEANGWLPHTSSHLSPGARGKTQRSLFVALINFKYRVRFFDAGIVMFSNPEYRSAGDFTLSPRRDPKILQASNKKPNEQAKAMTPITQSEINKSAWGACDTFRGVVDPSIYKDYVLTMLFLKYVSDVWKDHRSRYEVEHPGAPELVDALMQQEAFVLPTGAGFDDLHAHRHEAGNGERIDKALHAIEEANGDKLRDVFQDISFNSNKLGDEEQKNDILRHLLEDFVKPALDLRPSRVGQLDIIGGAYEYLISRFAATAGKKAGEFYTPAEVSDLMARLADPQPGDHICDPTCGSASLLMKCGKLIRDKGGKGYALFGQEAIGSTWALAKMNLFLHGEVNHQVEWGDTIRNPKLRTKDDALRHYDIVVANPPFSLDKWGTEAAETDKFGRFRRGIPPKTKGDYAFILHMIETLKPKTGRAVVVVPHGVLFRGSTEGKIRQKLVEENLLDAVIGLPEKLFFGTGIPAALLVFRKHKTDDSVMFVDASREFISSTNQNALDQTFIDKIVSTYAARQSVDKYAYSAIRAEIEENDFNLNIPRYVDTFEEEEQIDLTALRAERQALKADLAELETRMEGYLRELGYGS